MPRISRTKIENTVKDLLIFVEMELALSVSMRIYRNVINALWATIGKILIQSIKNLFKIQYYEQIL